jgi:hypothetical protein
VAVHSQTIEIVLETIIKYDRHGLLLLARQRCIWLLTYAVSPIKLRAC